MNKLINLIAEIKDRPLQISVTEKSEQIQQTQRNNLKAELLQAIAEDIKSSFEFVFQSSDGILLEIANDSIADNLKNTDGSGAITVCIDIKVKNLECNAELESADFMKKIQEKAEKKKEELEKKKGKVARDKKEREEKKALLKGE